MSAWQPIDTAPRDGTTILTWHRRLGVMTASWGRTDTTYSPPGWIGGHCHVSHIDQPSHWMHLPEPPQEDR